MGDVVIATAALEDLARGLPDAEIDLSTLPPWRELFADDPRLTRVLALPVRSGGFWTRARTGLRWVRTVLDRDYDAIVDLQGTDRSRVLLALVRALHGLARRGRGRAGRTAGIAIAGNRAVFPYTHALSGPLVREDGRTPLDALGIARRALAALGVPGQTPGPVLHPGPRARDRVRALQARHGLQPGRYGVFLPGSQRAGYLKRWGAARYASLARQLLGTAPPGGRGARRPERIVLVGGPDDVEEARAIMALLGLGEDGRPDGTGSAPGGERSPSRAGDPPLPAPAVINLVGETELLDLPLLCADALFVVGNDTGTAHLAAASPRPVLVLCGPTDPARVKPPGAHVRALQADIPCRSCYRKQCAHQSCMALLTPEQVREAVLALIQEAAPG